MSVSNHSGDTDDDKGGSIAIDQPSQADDSEISTPCPTYQPGSHPMTALDTLGAHRRLSAPKAPLPQRISSTKSAPSLLPDTSSTSPPSIIDSHVSITCISLHSSSAKPSSPCFHFVKRSPSSTPSQSHLPPSMTDNDTNTCTLAENEKQDHDEDEETDQESLFSRKKRRMLMIRKIAYIIIMNAALPIALYYILKPHIAPVWALILSSTPTIISVILQVIFVRRIDTIGIAVIVGFTLSVILAVINGDPKLLLMRESFVTAGIGVACSITLIPIRIRSFQLKPILYYIANDLIPLRPVYFTNPDKPPQKRMLFYWQHSAYCRRHIRTLTVIDIVFLEFEFGLKLFYIFTFDLDTIVVLSNSTLSAIGVLLTLFSLWYILKIRKRIQQEEPRMLQDAGAIK